MKTLMTLAILALSATAAQAQAEPEFRSRHLQGVTTFPSHWLLDKGPRVIHVPARMDGTPAVEFNTNPDWGKGCRSCFDASK